MRKDRKLPIEKGGWSDTSLEDRDVIMVEDRAKKSQRLGYLTRDHLKNISFFENIIS
jgi:hypothetical protein